MLLNFLSSSGYKHKSFGQAVQLSELFLFDVATLTQWTLGSIPNVEMRLLLSHVIFEGWLATFETCVDVPHVSLLRKYYIRFLAFGINMDQRLVTVVSVHLVVQDQARL